MMQMKIQMSMTKDMHTRAVQEKAAEDREERLRKLNTSRKMHQDYKKNNAEQKKMESRQLEEIKSKGKEYTEYEKRQRVEEEKRRYVQDFSKFTFKFESVLMTFMYIIYMRFVSATNFNFVTSSHSHPRI